MGVSRLRRVMARPLPNGRQQNLERETVARVGCILKRRDDLHCGSIQGYFCSSTCYLHAGIHTTEISVVTDLFMLARSVYAHCARRRIFPSVFRTQIALNRTAVKVEKKRWWLLCKQNASLKAHKWTIDITESSGQTTGFVISDISVKTKMVCSECTAVGTKKKTSKKAIFETKRFRYNDRLLYFHATLP